MQLLSVNVGQERDVNYGKSGRSSIHKLPAAGPVRVTAAGLEGDMVSDTENHGGVDQAVYVFGVPDYAWWSASLNQDLAPGTFGENLTITDLESAPLRIGDRLHIRDMVLQVTAPRIPCVVLAGRMGDPGFVKRFRQGERPGAYCRVLAEGVVQAGDPVHREPYPGETLTVLDFFRLFYEKTLSEEQLRRLLAAPIDIRSRAYYEEQLAAQVASR